MPKDGSATQKATKRKITGKEKVESRKKKDSKAAAAVNDDDGGVSVMR